MSDLQKLSTQWLQTDAALGLSEVPLPKHRPAPAPAPVIATPVPIPPPRLSPRPIPAPPRVIPPSPSKQSDPTMAQRKPVIPMPPPPAGDISTLPPLTPEQKQFAMTQWLADLATASAPFINEIATRLVPGEGDINSPLLFVGEGPGTEEDRTGRPFVGKSGELLTKMITAMGFSRQTVYIANIVKLRCASWDEDLQRLKDRPPTPEEAARGLPFLHRQIEIIRPRAIVTLGATAIKYLTNETRGVMSIRGTWQSYRGLPVMPTYHPAFVLRNYTEETRRKVWQDLQDVMKRLAQPV